MVNEKKQLVQMNSKNEFFFVNEDSQEELIKCKYTFII